MDKKSQPVNEFVARGIVKDIGRDDYGGMTLTLLVQQRRSMLTLKLKLERGAARGIRRKDRVVVRGYTRAFSYHNDALNKDSAVMYFVATEVKQDETELSQRFGKDIVGNFYPEPVFRAFIAGKVKEAAKLDNKEDWGQLIISTCGGGQDQRPSNVIMRYWLGGRLPKFDFEPGDFVCTRLSAYTPTKQSKKGKEYIFQNLVVEDIAYLDKKNKNELDPGNMTAHDVGMKPPSADPSQDELMVQELANMAAANKEVKIADDSALMGES